MASSPQNVPAVAADDTRSKTRALYSRLAENCDLPPMPAVASQAMRLVREPDARAEDVARVVATDAAIAARVLQISRSAMYARSRAPRTLGEAIVTLGFQQLQKILVAASARAAYRVDDAVAQRLWAHSLATALAADELAAAAREPRGGASFLAGLLHDVGRLVFHITDPAAYLTLGHCDDAAETAVFGGSHAVVGACLAEHWGLDSDVVEAIMGHHGAPAAGLALRVSDADRIAGQIGCGAVDAQAEPPETPEAAGLVARVAATFEAERGLFD